MGRLRKHAPSTATARVEFWRDPALPYLVDARTTHLADDPFQLHTHDCLMLSLVETGCTRLQLRRGLLPVPAGAVALVPPEEPHACNPVPGEDFQYRALFLRADWLTASQEESLRAAGGAVLHHPMVRQALQRAYAVFRGPGERLEKDEAFHELLAAACGETGPADPPRPSPCSTSTLVRTVQAHLLEHLERAVTLDELAAAIDLSPYQLLRRFRQQVGLSPHAWQMQRRIERAKTLLAQGMPPVAAALETGFADQSHFHRVFKRHVGATPGQYQAGGRCKIVQSTLASPLA